MIRTSEGTRTRPAGFTLIEMLVVITLVAILVALTAAAAVRFMASSYTSATRTTIQRANSRLQQQMAWLLDQARTEAIPTQYTLGNQYTAVGGKDANSLSGANPTRARVIHI